MAMLLKVRVCAPLMLFSIIIVGCGQSANDASPLQVRPNPGEMIVVSMEELPEPVEKPLIENGSFENWVVGSPGPSGHYTFPSANSKASTLLIEQGVVSEGTKSLRQRWTRSDWGDLRNCFGITVTKLNPNTSYKFQCKANTLNKYTGFILLAFDNISPFGEIRLTKQSDFKTYSWVFNTRNNNRVQISTFGPEDPADYPNEIVFDEWSLKETTEEIDSNIPSTDSATGLLDDASFEQWKYVGNVWRNETFIFPKSRTFAIREFDDVVEGKYACHQIWPVKEDTDNIWRFWEFAYLDVKVVPNYRYELTVKGKNIGGTRIGIDIFGSVAGLRKPVSVMKFGEINPSTEWTTIKGAFDTDDLTRIRFSVSGCESPSDGNRNEILWDDWRLVKIGPSAERTMPAPSEGSLIQNGSFEYWYAGRSQPEGDFIFPSSSLSHSTATRTHSHVADGNLAILQEWTNSDSSDEPDQLLGVKINNLKPNKNYTFTCKYLLDQPGFAPKVRFYSVEENNEYTLMEGFDVDGGSRDAKWTLFKCTFNTKLNKNFLITMQTPRGYATYPTKIVWDDFQLVETMQ